MVVRNGLAALQQFSQNNIPKQLEVDGTTYSPTLKNNVILVWVKEEDANKILNSPKNVTKSCSCAGGVTRPLFFEASAINVKVHETGSR